MAVEAVGAVVIQRVTDLLIQESNIFDNIIHKAEDIRLKLRHMRRFLIHAEQQLNKDPEAKKWAEKYLKTLFSLEDETEKYVLGLVRRKRATFIVFLERQTGFFLHDYLKSGRALPRRLESIKGEIKDLERTRPDHMVNASLVGSCSNDQEDDDDDAEQDVAEETCSEVLEGGMNEVENDEDDAEQDDAEQNDADAEETCSEVVEGGMNEVENDDDERTKSSTVEPDGIEFDLMKTARFKNNLALNSPSSFSPKKHSRKLAISQRKAQSFPGFGRAPSYIDTAAAAPVASMHQISGEGLRTSFNLKRNFGIVGFRKHIALLVKRLKEKEIGFGGAIPVVGPPGSGKTTLVRAVNNDLDIKNHFGNDRVWVHLPNEACPPFTGLWMKMVQEITKVKENGMSDADQLKTKLIEFLKKEEDVEKKRYLIVLDSVHSLDVWEKLSSGFPNLNKRESKVILITRDTTIVRSSECGHPHIVTGLSEDHSWKLFLEKLHPPNKDILKDYSSFRSQILKTCGHLPLNIVLLGGLLSTKEFWYLTQARWKTMDILSLSYNDLPAHSKLCLLFMSLFPSEVGISVRRLHRLWLAEGFVRRSPGMTAEESVEECFDDLVKRNLITISKRKADESSRNCRLPSSIRDFLLPKAADISLFHIHQGSATSESNASYNCDGLGIRRFVEYADIRNFELPVCTSPPFEHLRSYLSFSSQRNDTPAKQVGNFISKYIVGKKGFGLLRVLDLEGVYKPTLPETLKQLFHLRYLGLRWTFTDHLPDSVGDLYYLETLDLKRTYINSLPSSIRKLKHLRYLNLPNICLKREEKRPLPSSFTELQTLLGLVIDENTPVEDDLNQLLKLRELGITCKLNSSKSTSEGILPDYLWSWTQQLINLRSLWLRSKDEMGRPAKITLGEDLSGLKKLSYMSLMGNLEKLVGKDKFPPNLKVISLSVSRLNEDPMPILAKLPELSVLRLLADSYLGERMVCPENGFAKLRVLKIWMLKSLVEWKVEENGMPCIEELNIRCCPNLQQIPIDLLSTLVEVTLTKMPQNIVEEVRNKKGQQLIINVDDKYVFTELPWENPTDEALWQAS